MSSRSTIRKQILEHLRNHGNRDFRPKELAKRLNYRDNDDYQTFRDVLEELRESGAVASARGGLVSFRPTDTRLTGTLSVHPDGYGFVNVGDGEEDWFVRARRMGTAIDGDLVEIARAAPVKGDRRRSAEVLAVLERRRTSAVGTLHDEGAYAVVVPDDRRLTHDVYIAREALMGAVAGDKVVVTIDAFEDPRGAIHGRVLKVLGPATDAAVQTLAVAMSQGIVVDFPDPVIAEADAAPSGISEAEVKRRVDLRAETVFTIDPVDAKDFDDALHFHTYPDGTMELGVHIADVSYFVTEDSEIDREAYRRGTSVYLVDRTIPMLPPRLSADLCSLRPDEDRLAFSCIMRFDRAGRRLSHRFERTVIRSGYRLSYEEAQRILDGQASGHELAETLAAVNALARGLGERRRQSGSVDFGMSEVQIDLDDSGHPVNIRPKKRLDSHRLIEECMLIANRTVAEALADSRIDPFVSRIHEHPNPEKIAQLATYVRVFGYELPHEDGIVQPKDLNALLESVRDEPEAPVIEQAALRAMARARYAIEPIGHFGLAFDQYTHFTSPIRRYPDLIVHRLVHRMMVGAPGVDGAKLKDACDRSSERERVAVEAERASVELKQVVYAADHVGDDFEGVVAGVSRYGVYVELPALLVEGMVHVRDMDDDYYEYDERTFALVGLQTGKRFRPGDRVHVRLAAARIESREIDLAFIGPPKASRRSGSGPRGKRDAGSRRPERGGTGKRSKRRRR